MEECWRADCRQGGHLQNPGRGHGASESVPRRWLRIASESLCSKGRVPLSVREGPLLRRLVWECCEKKLLQYRFHVTADEGMSKMSLLKLSLIQCFPLLLGSLPPCCGVQSDLGRIPRKHRSRRRLLEKEKAHARGRRSDLQGRQSVPRFVHCVRVIALTGEVFHLIFQFHLSLFIYTTRICLEGRSTRLLQ